LNIFSRARACNIYPPHARPIATCSLLKSTISALEIFPKRACIHGMFDGQCSGGGVFFDFFFDQLRTFIAISFTTSCTQGECSCVFARIYNTMCGMLKTMSIRSSDRVRCIILPGRNCRLLSQEQIVIMILPLSSLLSAHVF
jgi:hypothetical protein